MPGKHRKQSPIQTQVAKRGGTGLAAAALSVTGLSTAVVTGTTAAVAPNVQLMALVSAANSTSQFFAGSSYYGTDWSQALLYGQQDVVPFYKGPDGIADAIIDDQTGAKNTGVTGSGWGAGQAGTALGILAANDAANGSDPDVLPTIGLVILDNNTNRAGGGFWTTYAAFAPLLGTSAAPTPDTLTTLGGPVLDVAYEYNINSDAPVDPLNPFALGNSLAAYALGYGEESSAVTITQDGNGNLFYTPPNSVTQIALVKGTHYVVDSEGNLLVVNPQTGTTSPPTATNTGTLKNANGTQVTTVYITVDSGELPLTKPLRWIPGGDILANAVDPTLTKLVDAGYADGKGTATDPAIPANPSITRPMKPFSSLSALDAGDLQDSAQQGATDGAQTAVADITNPGNLITKPIGEFSKLPALKTITNSISSLNQTGPLTTTSFKATPNAAKSGTSSSSTNSKPLQKIANDFNSSLKNFAANLPKPKAAKPPTSNDDED